MAGARGINLAANPRGCPNQKLFRRKICSSPSLRLSWDALNPLSFSKTAPALLSSTMAPNLWSSALFHHLLPPTPAPQPAPWQPLPAARHLLPAELAGMTPLIRAAAQSPGGLQGEETQMQPPAQPPAPTLLPPQHSHHSLPRAAAPARLPAPSPFLPTGTGHGCGHGELCAVQTWARCELFLALWLKILGKAVLSSRRRSRKRRVRKNISDPRMGQEPCGV